MLDALDADQDHELSASEIDNAAAALKSLDRNDDGKLTEEELRRPHPPGGPRQFDGPPHRRSERRPHDDIEDAPPHRPARGPNAKGPAEKPRPHEPDENDLSKPNRKPPRGPMPRGPMPPGPPPERLVRDAFSFDSDEDGKLDREELEAFFRRLSPREAGEKPPRNPPHAERPERPPSD